MCVCVCVCVCVCKRYMLGKINHRNFCYSEESEKNTKAKNIYLAFRRLIPLGLRQISPKNSDTGSYHHHHHYYYYYYQ